MKRHFAIAFASLLLACGGSTDPRSQWVIEVTTDATVPNLGDRLLLEFSPPTQPCTVSCRRLLGVETAERLPLSFGVVSGNQPLFVRARLFRDVVTGPGGEPTGNALIDRVGRLNPPDAIERVSLRLAMKCFGAAATLDESCNPDTGLLEPVADLGTEAHLQPGTFAQTFAGDCSGTPPDGMRCVSGSLYLFGDPHPEITETENASVPEHLVAVSPFFLDATEVTVGEYRQLRQSDPSLPEPALVNDPDVTSSQFCQYLGASVPDHDARPLNCIDHALAEKICSAKGSRLPTEAEWELAAGNGSAETRYPWGDDDDVCKFAIVARNDPTLGNIACRASSSGTLDAGPVDVETSLDESVAGVRDLAGNVAEWTADAFAPRDATCWSGGTPALIDPRCSAEQADGTGRFTVRGGSYADAPATARGRTHFGHDPSTRDPRVGVRCAR